MKTFVFFLMFSLGVMASSVFAQTNPAVNAVTPVVPQSMESIPPQDLNQFIYSYGTVLKASATEVVLQEYDYDSDVEKEVTYQVDPTIRLEGIKATTDLVADDVIEIYYLEQDGKKIARIIRKEAAEEDENTESAAPVQTNS